MIELFYNVCRQCSKITAERYSTSFASAIRLLHKDLHSPIYNIYGFVRFADEIVDTFHDHDKQYLLQQFQHDTFDAISRGISLNPILQSFQETVNQYRISPDLITAFLNSMFLDLEKKNYDSSEYNQYIYGSAEVVGLMCLQVFCEGDKQMFDELEPYAKKLGAAFQKVNFLRDLKADTEGLSRMYFPNCDLHNFSEMEKQQVEADIQNDFNQAYKGILMLPIKARFGVYVAYKYYMSLFNKIKRVNAVKIRHERIRIPNFGKALIVAKAGLRSQFNIL